MPTATAVAVSTTARRTTAVFQKQGLHGVCVFRIPLCVRLTVEVLSYASARLSMPCVLLYPGLSIDRVVGAGVTALV